MKLSDTMICWNRAGWVKVGPHPDRSGWSDAYDCSDGACFADWRGLPSAERMARLFVMFVTMVTADGVSPSEAHRALLEIDEYRDAMPPELR